MGKLVKRILGLVIGLVIMVTMIPLSVFAVGSVPSADSENTSQIFEPTDLSDVIHNEKGEVQNEGTSYYEKSARGTVGTVNKEAQLEKVFTVTRRPFNDAGAEEELVGEFDTFYAAMEACKQEQLDKQYIITMNADYTAPSSEANWGKSNVNIILRSKGKNQFTLTKKRETNLFNVYNNATIMIENIILDGANMAGAFTIFNGGTVTLGNGTTLQHFIKPSGNDYNLGVDEGGTLNINDGVTIQNNKSVIVGGLIYARSGSTLNIKGGDFIENTSEKNGGVIAAYGGLNISGGNFRENEAKIGGAIIIGRDSNASIRNATFVGNKASSGGAIYTQADLSMSGVNMSENSANWGGGVFISSSSLGTTTIEKSSISKNSANYMGGAIYLQKGKLTVIETTFAKNSAKGNPGGAIFINKENQEQITIDKSEFTENSALKSFGGAIYASDKVKLAVTNSNFQKNLSIFGGGISTPVNVTDGSKLSIDGSTFEENQAASGGSLFTAFPTDIKGSKFNRNKALLVDGDDEKNPHKSGTGGAVTVSNNKTIIEGTTFGENSAYGSGGAICINGVARNDQTGEVTEIKPNIMVEISDGSRFLSNSVEVGQGGAIFITPYEYATPITDKKAYKKLKTDETTLFKGNTNESGKHNPPSNFEDFTNLEFDPTSDVLHETLIRESLLNNYDVNYINPNKFITYRANGGVFSDNKEIYVEEHSEGKIITLAAAPTKKGYTFDYWKGSKYQPGDEYKVIGNHTFTAHWKNEPPILEVKDKSIIEGKDLDLMSLVVKATDKEDGDLTKDVKMVDNGGFDKDKVGEYVITFEVKDSGGATAKAKAKVTVNPISTNPGIVIPEVCTIRFDLDGGILDGKTGIVVEKHIINTYITMKTPTKEGYTFEYWQDPKYYAGDKYLVLGAHEFKAIWKKNSENIQPNPDKDKSDTGSTSSNIKEKPDDKKNIDFHKKEKSKRNDNNGDINSGNTHIPKTGDSSSVEIFGGLLSLSGGALLVLMALRIHKMREEK